MSLEEPRQPWYLLVSKSTTKKAGMLSPPTPTVKYVHFKPDWWDRNYYTFQEVDSDLLIAIDQNNVPAVEKALKKDKVNVNSLYLIPFWEVPEVDGPQLQTFLHRALWEEAPDVFDLLLKKGANPRIKGRCQSTVIHDLFDGHTDGENILKFGKMLIAAGVTSAEIGRAYAHTKSMEYKPFATALIRMAKPQKAKIAHHKGIAFSADNHPHVRN